MIQDLTFVIIGNQEDPKGNPLGYKRTLNHSFRDDAVRYFEWIDYVRKAFHDQLEKVEDKSLIKRFLQPDHPITLGKSEIAQVTCDIEFMNNARADCDNVYKGILDALFSNDKYVMHGCYNGRMAEDKVGKVTVNIKIMDKGP